MKKTGKISVLSLLGAAWFLVGVGCSSPTNPNFQDEPAPEEPEEGDGSALLIPTPEGLDGAPTGLTFDEDLPLA